MCTNRNTSDIYIYIYLHLVIEMHFTVLNLFAEKAKLIGSSIVCVFIWFSGKLHIKLNAEHINY